jgi:hypothetical protein
LVDDLLYYNDERGARLVIPVSPNLSLRSAIMHEFHDAGMAGHLGVEKTYSVISRVFYWSSLYSDVVKYIAQCYRCLRDKHSTARAQGMFSAHSSDEPYPFHTWAIDEIVALPMSNSGNDQLLVCTEHVTGMLVLIPCKKTNTAVDDATAFFQRVVCRYGMVSRLLLDRHPKYTSLFWAVLWKLSGTKLNFSTAFHKTSVGQAERRNQFVEQLFRHLLPSIEVSTWDEHCPLIEFQANNSVSATHGLAANEAVFGRLLDTPAIWLSTSVARPIEVPAVSDFAAKQAMMFQRCKDAMRHASDISLAQRNLHRRDPSFKVGDWVLIKATNFNMKHRGSLACHKLMPAYLEEAVQITGFQGTQQARAFVDLPPALVRARISNLFHVSDLKLVPIEGPNDLRHPVADVGSPQVVVEQAAAVPQHGYFIIESILEARASGRTSEYLVKFADYDDCHNAWVRRSALTAAAKAEADEKFPLLAPKPKAVQPHKPTPPRPVRASARLRAAESLKDVGLR